MAKLELTQGDVARVLLAHPIFQGLTPQEAVDFAAHCQVSHLPPGGVLFQQGDVATDIFLVLSGQLTLVCDSPDGIPVVVGTVADGTVVGEMGVFDDAPRSATASAAEDATLLALPGEAFATMVDLGHAAAHSLLRWLRAQLCERLRVLDKRLDAVFTSHDDDTDEADQQRVLSPKSPVRGAPPRRDVIMIQLGELRHLPALKGLNDTSLRAIAGVMVRRSFVDDVAIMRQGQAADGVHLLLRGHVRVTRELPDSGSVDLVTMGPGALFGALAALDGRNRAASCIAWGEVQTGFLSLADFSALMDGRSPTSLRFQVAVLRTLFTDIRSTNQRLAELATLPEMDMSALGDVITGLA